MTDDEVEEAIQGTSMLLHHVVPSKNNKTDGATGATGGGATGATGGATGATEMQTRLYQPKRKIVLISNG